MAHPTPARHRPTCHAQQALRTVAQAAALLCIAAPGASWAQSGSSTPQRVEITGSSIKRIAVEGALPMQTITRDQLDKQGIVNAEQLISTLTINANGLDNLASNADVVSGQSRGNNGATSANLRSQGANATLILLNGRRIAAHGLNGGVVDLNQIPMAAVERVEVLKDGASSIYGTDAVGGVINFILRNDFNGLRASASVDATEAGGGNVYRAALLGGWGQYERDGFNLMASLSVTDSKMLRGDQRDFVNSFQPGRGLSPDTRGTPYGTLFLAATNANTIPNVLTRPGGANNGTGPLYNGATLNSVNTLDLPGAAGCASQAGTGPYAELLWNSATAAPASQLGCAYDTGRAAVIQQPVKNTNLVTRGQLKLGEHRLTAELLLGRSESAKVFSENQISSLNSTATTTLPNLSTVPSPFRNLAYPATGSGYARVFNALVASFPELAVNNGLPMTFRWRCMVCGPREYDTTTDTGRFLLALDGPLPWGSGWDYRIGASEAYSKSSSVLGGGYHNWVGLANLINTGVLNPFLLDGESQSAAAIAGLDAISARGTRLYGGKYTTTQVDATVQGPLFKMPAGEALVALGVDLRREKYSFDGNLTVNTNDINTWIFNAAFDNINALGGVKRDIKAVFGEVVLPITKQLELNLSARYDEYTGFGSTSNPKASLRWAPLNSLVFRASYGTGFRVPTFNQQFNGVTESINTGAGFADPATCPSGVVSATPGCAAITGFTTYFGGVPSLQPETSKMANLGFIWQPLDAFSVSVDWWEIRRKGTIQELQLTGTNGFFANYALLSDRFIRDANGVITGIDRSWINSGETQTAGLELGLRGNGRIGDARWTAGMDVSYMTKKRSRLLPSSPYGVSELGRFNRAGELGIRWKHGAFATYTRGPWSGTLRQQYVGGYIGYVPPGVANGNLQPAQWDAKVKPYLLHHASVAYSGIKNLTVTAGVKNLFDRDPPFANSYDTNTGSGSSWEPRVADPRGRAYTLAVEYTFF